jgi:hypothetical protein
MSEYKYIFGYIESEDGRNLPDSHYVDVLNFNQRAIDKIRKSKYWDTSCFRVDQTRSGQSVQLVTISSFFNSYDDQEIFDELLAILKTLHWSHAHIVNHSVDRSLNGEPTSIEYQLQATSRVKEIASIKEVLKINKIERLD